MSSGWRRRSLWRGFGVGLVALIAVGLAWPWLKHLLREEQAARLFPDAAEVRVFAWGFMDAEPKFFEVAPEGIALTKGEMETLRGAVFWVKSPAAIDGCCIPWHGFKFYDAQHKILGELEVCFECICANLEGETPPKPHLDWVDWDIDTIESIIRAHNLPIEFEYDAVKKIERPKFD